MADHVIGRKDFGTYEAPSTVEPCRSEQAPYTVVRAVTTRDGNYQKPSTIVMCPWYLEKMKRAVWTDSTALTSVAGRIQAFQQWPDLRATYGDAVAIDFYVFFDDTLVHEVVYSSCRYYHY